MNINPFISIHRISADCTFPILYSQTFPDLSDSICTMEWIFLAKRPTLLATDANSLLVFEFMANELSLLRSIKLHTGKDFAPNPPS